MLFRKTGTSRPRLTGAAWVATQRSKNICSWADCFPDVHHCEVSGLQQPAQWGSWAHGYSGPQAAAWVVRTCTPAEARGGGEMGEKRGRLGPSGGPPGGPPHTRGLFGGGGGGRLVKHARYDWLLLAERHLTRQRFGSMLRMVAALPLPDG